MDDKTRLEAIELAALVLRQVQNYYFVAQIGQALISQRLCMN